MKFTKYIICTKMINQDNSEYVMCQKSIITEGTWEGNTELEEVEFGDNITQIGAYAFENCTSLTTVTFHTSLKRIDPNAFAGCTALQKIVAPDTLEEVDCWLDGKRAVKLSLFNPSSEELIENLKKGYPMDLYYKGVFRDDYWD